MTSPQLQALSCIEGLPSQGAPAAESSARHRFTPVVQAVVDATGVFVRDIGRGMLEVSHNTFALVGMLVVAAALFTAGHDELRDDAEAQVLGWLQARQDLRTDAAEPGDATSPSQSAAAGADTEPTEHEAIRRATAIDPTQLSRQQAAVAQWLSRRYRVAPEPIGRLVHEAWAEGKSAGLDPTLILAIMAVESSFNPFAQSNVGAQGLMQVMTKIHNDKYQAFGGNHAAFDPVSNLRVGVQVLKECISRAGSLEAGLRYYVGAANLPDDGGYAAKVLSLQSYLREVVRGKNISPNAAMVAVVPPAAASASQPTAPLVGKIVLPQRPATRVATIG
jgi:soluble lytic murein transglycosylase-like protein